MRWFSFIVFTNFTINLHCIIPEPIAPLFQHSSIPSFPPGRRPYGLEANWGGAPNLLPLNIDNSSVICKVKLNLLAKYLPVNICKHTKINNAKPFYTSGRISRSISLSAALYYLRYHIVVKFNKKVLCGILAVFHISIWNNC